MKASLYEATFKVDTSYISSSHGFPHILFKQPPVTSKNFSSICGKGKTQWRNEASTQQIYWLLKIFFSRASTKLIPQDWSTSFNITTLFPGPTPRVGESENFTINFYLYAPANYNGGFGTSNSAKGKPEDVKSPLENKQRKY